MKRDLLATARRKVAEFDLLEFVRQAWHIVEPETRFIDGWHIEAICRHLEAVADGRIEQLLINVPPGTSKSTLVCVMWPAWVWATRPEARWLFASYADTLSVRDSIRCRNILCSEWYQMRWGKRVELTWDQNQKIKFDNTAGGWRVATTVGGVSIGVHPGFVVADDPHKLKGVESETERQSVIDWWDGAMSSRGLIKGVRRVVIMQRLHQSDLSGHLLAKGGWDHIHLPMKFEADRKMKPTRLAWSDPRKEDGELLWPQVYSADKVTKMELDLGLYHAASQLQQRPSPRGGGMFHRDWFEIIQTIPADIDRQVRYWDKAATKDGEGARSAGVLLGRTRTGLYVVLDVVKGRWSAAEREAVIKQTAFVDRDRFGWVETWTEQEPGSGGKESAENTVRNLEGFACYAERVTGDKATRAEPLQSHAKVGNVKLLVGQWNAEFIEEAELFPMGRRKDQIDGASGAFNKLAAQQGRSPVEGSAYQRREIFADAGSRLRRGDF